jgi:hypothetical protein
MLSRAILLFGAALALSACGDGNPAFNAKISNGNPYDVSDAFLDKNGNPLPGWWFMRDSTGGPSGM